MIEDGEGMDILSHTKSSMYVVVIEKEFLSEEFYNYFLVPFEDAIKKKRFFIKEESINSFIKTLSSWMSYLQSSEFLELKQKPYFEIESSIISSIFEFLFLKESEKQRTKFDIQQVRNILDESIHEKISIHEVLKYFNISERNLHNAFKLTYATSPKRYLQNLKLNAVRSELLQREFFTTSVADIAFKYGFTHMSHFTKEYKKMFLELPTHTLKKNKFAV